MIHEHDDLILASAAIDFGLTSEESDRLARAIADCPICAERAAAYRRQMRLLAELPELEPSDAVRRRVTAVAMAGRQPQTRAPLLLLAAGLAIVAALALLAAAVGAIKPPRLIAEYPPIEVTVSPSASAVVAPSERPGSGPSRSGLPTGGGPDATIAPDVVAEVISTNLRLRSQPRIAADSIKFEPFLTVGDRLFVVAGPVTATNHDWYEVAAWRPSDPSASWPIGWVATADISGTPWIAATSISCPPTPTVDVLGGMRPLEALACYGDRSITFRAYVQGTEPTDSCLADAPATCLDGPTWLAGSDGRRATVDARVAGAGPAPIPLPIARNPAGTVPESDLASGRMVMLTGSFDHSAADGCSLGGPPDPTTTLARIDAVLRCRTVFVVAAATPDPASLSLQVAAITTTPNLRVRSLPLVDGSSERFEPLLDQGTRLFVLEGPVIGSGYDWYRVLVPSVTRAGGDPMLGWVAVASKTGEIWAADIVLGCPPVDRPVLLADLQRLGTGAVGDGGVSCFGDVPIRTVASLNVACPTPGPIPTSAAAGWLAAPARVTVQLLDGEAAFDGRVHPDLAGRIRCDLGGSARWTATGHFDDADAPSCAAGAASDGAAELARYRCRSIFVVTDLAPAAP